MVYASCIRDTKNFIGINSVVLHSFSAKLVLVFVCLKKQPLGFFFFFFLMSGSQVSRNEGRINLGPFSSNCMDAARSLQCF